MRLLFLFVLVCYAPTGTTFPLLPLLCETIFHSGGIFFMAKPGVMMYFDLQPCLQRLSYEDKGRLFEAILDYGKNGVLPDFDGALAVAWDFIQPRIDHDHQRYMEISQKRRAAALSRNNCKQMQPTSTTTTTSSSTSTSNARKAEIQRHLRHEN